MLYLFISPLSVLLGLVAVSCGIFYWYTINSFNYWKKRGIPFVKPIPVFGNIKDFLLRRKHFAQMYQELYQTTEGHPYVGVFFSTKPNLMIRDPDLIKSVLVKDFQHFHDRDITISPDQNPLTQHLFTLHGQKWRALRAKLSPTFSSGKMKAMFTIMNGCCENLKQFLEKPAEEGAVIEMKETLARFTTDVVGNCVFGLQMNAMTDPNSEFRIMGKKVTSFNLRRMLVFIVNTISPRLIAFLKISLIDEDITRFFMGIVKETSEFRLNNNVTRNDFMQLLMKLRHHGKLDDPDDENRDNDTNNPVKNTLDFEFDDGVMAVQAFVFFVAGFETSSSSMSMAIHELAVNPDIQQKLREEVDQVLEENDGNFTYDTIMNMKYLDKVISETLRKYSPVPFLRREVTSPYLLPGSDIPLEKGLPIIIPTYGLHYDPKYYPNPEKFDPERFSEEARRKRPHYTYLPFGEGPRNCIGMRFGLMQSKLGLATLVSKFEFHVCGKTVIPPEIQPAGILVSTKEGIMVRITNRN